MENEKLKILAGLVLVLYARLVEMEKAQLSLIEIAIEAGEFAPVANALRAQHEQIEACARDSVPEIKRLREYFGLEPEPDQS